jgi:hypothetical protein
MAWRVIPSVREKRAETGLEVGVREGAVEGRRDGVSDGEEEVDGDDVLLSLILIGDL